MRAIYFLIGFSVVAAATHLNVMHSGGYSSPDTPLLIALAFLVAACMSAVGFAFSSSRYLVGVALLVCTVSGEAYWLLTNADRELASRAQAAEPHVRAHAAHIAAERRLADAKAAKTAADEAMGTEAAKDGCRKGCVELLLARQNTATSELNDARTALANAPEPLSNNGIADMFGASAEKWDLLLAALRSVGVLGGSFLIGLALHRPRPARAAPVSCAPVAPPLKTADVHNFLLGALQKAEGASVESKRLFPVYCAHAAKNGLGALSRELFELELATLWKEAGLEVQPVRNGIKVLGVKLAA